MMHAREAAGVLRLLRCRVAEQTYGLNMACVRGIQRLEQLHGQGDARGCIGWVSSGTEEWPVFRLTERLQQADNGGPHTGKILLLNTPSSPWALLVEGLESVIQVPAEAVRPLPMAVRNPQAPFFEGIVTYAGLSLLLLSPLGLHPEAAVRATALAHRAPEAMPVTPGVRLAAGARQHVIVFSVAALPQGEVPLWFGLSLSQVPQILQPLPLLSVPGAPDYVLGVAEWCQAPLAVIDLARRLGGTATPMAADSRLLVARATSRPAFVGLSIQPHVRMQTLPMPHGVSRRPQALHAALIRGQFDLAHATLVIPDMDGILTPSAAPGA